MKALAAFALMASSNDNPFVSDHTHKTKIVGKSNKTDKEKAKLKGLKEFCIYGETIYALNEKTAIKKFLKINNNDKTK